MKKMIKFVPFSLEGNKNIDKVINIGDRGNEIGKSFSFGIEVSDTTAAVSLDYLPRKEVGVTGIGINFRALTKNDFGDFGGNLRKSIETIN
jgi:hypothetical protein